MVIENFRGIKTEISIDLDDIVILVGGNNSGKSTILRAYEVAVNSEALTIDDFPDKKIDSENLPKVEIHTIVDDETAPNKEKWCCEMKDGEYLVKEKWTWTTVGPKAKPERLGYLVSEGRWATADDKPKKPWATDNVAGARRPKPHRVSTFDSPEIQSEGIKAIVNTMLEDQIRSFEPKDENDSYCTLFDKFKGLKEEFTAASRVTISDISKDISEIVSSIIPNHKFVFSIDENLSKDPFKIFDPSDIEIEFGDGDVLLPIINHGSGARRTLLWAVLKKLADMGYEATAKGKKYGELKGCQSHLLLLDEPETSLHPQAIRDACGVLYNLPNNGDWQVMITTHSPNFIDLSRDHTTIIRVESESDDKIKATTLYRPEDVSLTEDEKENIKLLNLIDPHVLEFFFGGTVLLVEGDTEYSAFNQVRQKLIEQGQNEYRDLLIIRARGKVQISSLMKVLNHFKKKYFVLHDCDTKTTQRRHKVKGDGGTTTYEIREMVNPAWSNNKKIENNMSEFSTVYASIYNFEVANFDEAIIGGKPLNALERMKDKAIYNEIEKLLGGIINDNLTHDRVIKWSELAQLETAIDELTALDAE